MEPAGSVSNLRIKTEAAGGRDPPADFVFERRLEVQPESHLAGAVAGVLRSLRADQRSEGGGAVDRRCGRREVGMIQDVGEG